MLRSARSLSDKTCCACIWLRNPMPMMRVTPWTLPEEEEHVDVESLLRQHEQFVFGPPAATEGLCVGDASATHQCKEQLA
mmetsp:Transcript_15253/g.48781  ORF Transcript_15253/g.48781 Transcript_15253/m.48781 type:complete len:80 (-) Transcript_15253:14-253(-)